MTGTRLTWDRIAYLRSLGSPHVDEVLDVLEAQSEVNTRSGSQRLRDRHRQRCWTFCALLNGATRVQRRSRHTQSL